MSNIVLVATTGFDGRLERVDTEREVQRKLDGIVKCIKDLSNVCIVVGSSTWLAARSVLEAFKLAPIIVLTRQTDQSRYNIPAYIRSETTLESCQEFARFFVLGGKKTFASLQSANPWLNLKMILRTDQAYQAKQEEAHPQQASKQEADQEEAFVFDQSGTVVDTTTSFEEGCVVRQVTLAPPLVTTSLQAKRHDEYAYLDLVEKTIQQGTFKPDRTGVGTLSLFGAQMRFDLSGGILPLLTTKKMAWKSIAEELLWFIAGDTNANTLSKKKVRIWDANASREFLDSRGLVDREQGDLGPVYGFQWRHFGAAYKDMHSDYTNQGVDQLAQVLHQLKTEPSSRRIIMTAWNPTDLDKMALPPCHMMVQFYVSNNKLSCHMYQRSADMGLGVPFNIASYALLTHIIAWATNLEAYEFIHSIGDCHVYLNHIESLLGQLKRQPKVFPKLSITNDTKDLGCLAIKDFEVHDYLSWSAIKMQMAV